MQAELAPMIPRKKYMGLIGAVMCDTHWERKRAIRAWMEDYQWTEAQDIGFCIWYERTFGFEFYKSDSIKNIERGGVSQRAPIITGYCKENLALALKSPSLEYESNILDARPYAETHDKYQQRKFQKKRNATFRKSRAVDQQLLDFSNPPIHMRNKNVTLELGASRPLWSDIRSLFFEGSISTTLLSGLRRDQLTYVSQNFPLAFNPIEAKSRGGYDILTPYYFSYSADPKWKDFITLLQESDDIKLRTVKRYDFEKTMKDMDPIEDFETGMSKSYILHDSKRVKLTMKNLSKYQDLSYYPPPVTVDPLQYNVQGQTLEASDQERIEEDNIDVDKRTFIDLIRASLKQKEFKVSITNILSKMIQPVAIFDSVDEESDREEDAYADYSMDELEERYGSSSENSLM
jgi:hypothetical protein